VRIVLKSADQELASTLNKYKWLKWTNRIFLILATIMPAVYTWFYFLYLRNAYSNSWGDWEILQWIIFIAPFVLFTWCMPILGGILILVGTHLGLFYYIFDGFFGGGMWGYFLFPQYFILIIAGILSIAWGIVRRRERKKINSNNSALKER
jgi:hypothetical protein